MFAHWIIRNSKYATKRIQTHSRLSIPTSCVLAAIVSVKVLAQAETIKFDCFAYPDAAEIARLPEAPRMVKGTKLNEKYDLFDRSAVDVNHNGIGDKRERTLMYLAVRFAPILIRNHRSLPLNIATLLGTEQPADRRVDLRFMAGFGKIISEAWNMDVPPDGDYTPGARTECEAIDLSRLGQSSCALNSESADCVVETLLKEFEPSSQIGLEEPERTRVRSVFVDFPGHDETSWRDEFEEFYDLAEVDDLFPIVSQLYVHPFIHKSLDDEDEQEFVLQYWMFYPYNDGGNNHEGDWEHINIVVGLPDENVAGWVSKSLSHEQIIELLHDDEPHEEFRANLVVGEIDYYMHNVVWTLNHFLPNVYAIDEAWREWWESRERSYTLWPRPGADWVASRLRERVKTEVFPGLSPRTHPISFIGANNAGTDQILAAPGRRNRNSQGNYPFPGKYHDIGPLGAAETVGRRDIEHYFRYDQSEALTLVPDWDLVYEKATQSSEVRKTWFWLLLPLQWGQRTADSPGASIGGGNASPFGPAFKTAWNRAGVVPGFAPYYPKTYSAAVPTRIQDATANGMGLLNLIWVPIKTVPPINAIDLVFRKLTLGFDRIYAPISEDREKRSSDYGPFRHLAIGGVFRVSFTREVEDSKAGAVCFTDARPAATFSFSQYMGDLFSVSNSVRVSESSLCGEDNVLQLFGGLQYSFLGPSRNRFRMPLSPYVHAGYGWSFTIGDGKPGADQVRGPGLLPNSWRLAFGLETAWLDPRPRGNDWSIFIESEWVRRSVHFDNHLLDRGLSTSGVSAGVFFGW